MEPDEYNYLPNLDFGNNQMFKLNPAYTNTGNTSFLNFNSAKPFNFDATQLSKGAYNPLGGNTIDMGFKPMFDPNLGAGFNNTKANAGMFDWLNMDNLETMGSVMDIGSSLMNGYLGFKSLGLAEDQFNLQKRGYKDQVALTQAQYDAKRNAQIEATGSSNLPELQVG